MLSFLKKNPDKGTAAPAWHPNFRNYALLPDTKVVRTSFFVNGLFVLLAAALLLAVVYQEYRIYNLRTEIGTWDQQIEKNSPASKAAVATFRRFQEEERKITELNAFLNEGKIVFSDFIIHLGQTLPQGIVLASVDYTETGVNIVGYVQGTSAEASGAASQYEKQLREDKYINTLFASVALPALPVRDAQAERLSFGMQLKFSNTAREGKR